MAEVALKRATLDDIAALPEGIVGEIVYGMLETHPRPAARHARTAFRLGGKLGPTFDEDDDGPGGWIFLPEQELHIGKHVLVPDLAGWRVERMRTPPSTAHVTIAPDWVCEIVSPSTHRLDRGAKRDAYAETGVAHLWLLDPIERLLEAFTLVGGRWTLVSAVMSGGTASAPPFDAISFPLDDLFPFGPPSAP
jgi:Uma2 family endonuclease